MSRESDAHIAMLNMQLEHDQDMREKERLHNLIIQGSKGLSILGGGAAVAMLALVQALIGEPSFISFKPFAVVSLSCFTIGAFLPAIAFFFHYDFINYRYANAIRERKIKLIWSCLGISAFLILIGGLASITGVAITI